MPAAPKSKSAISFERTWMSPALAAKLLERNQDNRSLKDAHVQRLARDIREGRWLEDCCPIRLAPNGRILDGQHRLWAVVEAEIAVWMIIASNVPEEAYIVMDSGIGRSWSDNTKHNLLISAVITYVHFWQMGQLAKVHNAALRPTHAERNKILALYPEIEDSVIHGARLRGVLTKSLAVFFHFVFHRTDAATADWFFDALTSGINLNDSMAVYWLAKRLRGDWASAAKLDSVSKMALIIKAWNAHRKGVPVRTLQWRDGEAFPEIL